MTKWAKAGDSIQIGKDDADLEIVLLDGGRVQVYVIEHDGMAYPGEAIITLDNAELQWLYEQIKELAL